MAGTIRGTYLATSFGGIDSITRVRILVAIVSSSADLAEGSTNERKISKHVWLGNLLAIKAPVSSAAREI